MASGAENFANVVLPLATVGGAFVAWYGVWSWKAQRKWEQSNELGQEILRSILTYRDALDDLRSPFDRKLQYLGAYEGKPEEELVEIFAMHDRRDQEKLDKLSVARRDLEALLSEAVIIWGDHAETWLVDISESEQRLRHQFTVYSLLEDPRVSEEDKELLRVGAGAEDIRFDHTKYGEKEETGFTEIFTAKIQELKSKVRKRMK
ncbi:hypothetical protein NBRC116590_02880 [Pelagimonas sp. KU-00592-HH]|uniref:hypothetical protein n=1 Tax=Pelagimonas sp. KU-00592-HH TaxID=3127651 RepID=UPI003107747B